MNRRQFLLWSGGAAVFAAGGFALFRRRVRVPEADAWSLALFDDRFSAYGREHALDAGRLEAVLAEKGVLDGKGGFEQARVRELARTDRIVAYEDYTYTETELQLYGLAWLKQRSGAAAQPRGD